MRKKFLLAVTILGLSMLAGCATSEDTTVDVPGVTEDSGNKEDKTDKNTASEEENNNKGDRTINSETKDDVTSTDEPTATPKTTATNTPTPTSTPTPKPKRETSSNYFEWFTWNDMDEAYLLGVKEGYNIPEEIVIPKMYNGKRVVLGEGAFENCEELKSVTIPEGMTEICQNAFRSCSNLSEVILPEGVTTIGYDAFSGCKNLKEIKLPESLTHIEGSAFAGTGLIEIVIPDGVKELGGYIFMWCENLKSITLPKGVTEIGVEFFAGCTNLNNITIPEGVTIIERGAFWQCTNLKSVILPESLTSIGERAFIDCVSLTNITIPKSVSYIGTDAFAGCTGLSEVPCTPTPTPSPSPTPIPTPVPLFTNVSVGDKVGFGVYEQDNDTSNGKEPVTWRVLIVKDNKALLLSEYVLDYKPFNETDGYVRWKDSSIRKWLNGDFYINVFSEEEKKAVLLSPLNTSYHDNNGNYQSGATEDYVFYLSLYDDAWGSTFTGYKYAEQLYRYIDESKTAKPTDYAVAQGIKPNSWEKDPCKFAIGKVVWGLRESGAKAYSYLYINAYGGFAETSVIYRTGVRPAIWVDLSLIAE